MKQSITKRKVKGLTLIFRREILDADCCVVGYEDTSVTVPIIPGLANTISQTHWLPELMGGIWVFEGCSE